MGETPCINRTCEVKSEVHGVRMTPLKRMACVCVTAYVTVVCRIYTRVCLCVCVRSRECISARERDPRPPQLRHCVAATGDKA